jgi:hypothetical protein
MPRTWIMVAVGMPGISRELPSNELRYHCSLDREGCARIPATRQAGLAHLAGEIWTWYKGLENSIRKTQTLRIKSERFF